MTKLQKFKKNDINQYIKITILYYLANFFILIISGCWWDDWTFMTHDLTYVSQVASQSGRPEWNLLIPLCWSLTNNGRLLIFVLYLFISLFVYYVLSNSQLLNENESFIIASIFTILPVNAAKILISNFPYTVGLFLFFLALCIFIKWNNSNKRILFRIIILLCFFFSFILNSLLAFYYLIFIYLFLLEYKNSRNQKIIIKIIICIKNVLIKYPDFFILPFIYFFLNKLLFPITDAEFSARSSVSIEGLLKCFKYIPLSIVNIFKEIVLSFYECVTNIYILIICVVTFIASFVNNKDKNTYNKHKSLYILLFGFIALILGLFAYVEVRGKTITSIGVKGRDSILTPLGISLVSSAFLLLSNNKVQKGMLYIFLFLSVCSSNLSYMEWQKDYYYQLSIENLLNNEIVENNDTFFFADLNESDVDGQRYYTLNINANHVFDDETRLFLCNSSNLYLLDSDDNIDVAKNILNGSHMMKDYNPEDYCIDAVLIYDADISLKELVLLKYHEIFDDDKFEEEIMSIGKLTVIEVEDQFTEDLLIEYKNDKVSNDYDIIKMLDLDYNY